MQIIDTVIAIIVFFFGAIIGSFLNVVILRYRSGRTLGGRSMCFSCEKKLQWTELVPIGSWITQKGKCTVCYAPISWQYPIVETVTGVLFVFLYYHFSYLLIATPLLFAILFAYYAFVFCVLIVLSVYDLRHQILPDGLTMLFSVLAFVGMFFISGDTLIIHFPSFWNIAAGILLPAPFALIWYFSKGKWMGLGDPKLMMGIGFLLGISSGITAIFLSFWIGAIVSLLILLVAQLNRKVHVSMKSAIPFGPFLVAATFITFFCQLDFTSIMNAISHFS
jgi:prepilin signal peptidase PulO-like enzyme (type II secretory pathway)